MTEQKIKKPEKEKTAKEETKPENKEGELKKQLDTEKPSFSVCQELKKRLALTENSLQETKKLAEERLTQLKYLQADFDNYRKQFEKEKCQIINLANESLIRELIVVLDDFDASINSMEEKDKPGIIQLQKKFFKILEKHGLCAIDAAGKKFNPHFHEVLCKECSDKEEDEITGEIQKGYMLNSKVIRASKVKVAKKKTEDKKEKNKEEKELKK